jgi:hypothetical protein
MSQQSHTNPEDFVPRTPSRCPSVVDTDEPLLSDADHAADMQQWKDEQLTARIDRNQDQDDE